MSRCLWGAGVRESAGYNICLVLYAPQFLKRLSFSVSLNWSSLGDLIFRHQEHPGPVSASETEQHTSFHSGREETWCPPLLPTPTSFSAHQMPRLSAAGFSYTLGFVGSLWLHSVPVIKCLSFLAEWGEGLLKAAIAPACSSWGRSYHSTYGGIKCCHLEFHW